MTKRISGAAQASILLVDDRADKILALETILAPLGQRLLKAQTGEEALRVLLQEEVAVIVMDVMMPGMDGFETAALIRQKESTKDVPIIFVSALDATNERVGRAYSLGAVDYVPGPSSPDALRAKVRVLVELYLKTRESKSKSEQMERMCYAVAHDLRAPLRTINGFCRALTEEVDGKLEDTQKQYLERICASVNRMSALTKDLLNFAKLQSGELAMQTVNLGTVARSTVNFLEEEIRKAEARITIREPMGEASGNEEVLIQVLRNLVLNAITYAEDGRRPEVEVFEKRKEGRVRLCVRDNGIGIAPEDTGKLFRMFERLSTSKKDGTGLGLAIVKSGIDRMGGKVGLESKLGEGSTFWLELAEAES
jgi:signal transduction histidine kinase